MKGKFSKKFLSLFLCIALIASYLPVSAMAAEAASDRISRVSDPSTMDTWQDYFLPDGKISTENAGGVWMDKSVFTNSDAFDGTGITLDSNDAFLVALSAMATSMTVTGMSHVPTDTMLILDVSASMGPENNNVASELIEAANDSIASLLSTNSQSRVGVVLYSGPTRQGGSATANDAVLVLPLGRYETENGIYLNLSGNQVSLNRNVVIAGTNTRPATASKSVIGGTYIQKGVMLAADQLTADGLDTAITDPVLGTIKRQPVMVLMSDGSPTFSSTNFQNPTSINLGDGTATSAAQGFVNQLTAAYAKKLVEEKYGSVPLFYTIGLGVANDAIALSVLDPDNAQASTAVNDFWDDEYTWRGVTYKTGYLNIDVGETVSLGNNRYVTKIATELEQNYVDEFINVTNSGSGQTSLGDKLIEAFADIVNKINLQSQYKPTLISHKGENHSGFISFVDKIGEYMQVTDIKGILINDTLYSGADLASNFVPGGGNLGTYDAPTELGREMVAAVRERIGLASDDEARTLIGLAYEYGQIRYTNANDYSNYIGWYADADSNFLGFYHDGVTSITDPNAVYIIRSYGYLGVEHDSNMMYATVQVRHNIQTGEETLAFAVPAALIPVMAYHVSLNEKGELLDVALDGSDTPIRLVYEVALDSHINEWNVTEVVSAEYLAGRHNVQADGSVCFYTNDWERTNATGYNTVNTYSYFNPSRQNDKYYFTSDALIYTDTDGTLYSGTSAPSADGTFYNAFTVYEKDGSALTKKAVYRSLSPNALATAQQAEGTANWYIPSGDVHVNLDGYTIEKATNTTHTLDAANQPFVDIEGHNVNDTNHSFYVGATLGNNGKLTLTPQTGIKLSKEFADGAAGGNEAFEFVITKAAAAESTNSALLIDVDGTEIPTGVSFNSSGVATVYLKAGQTLCIGDLDAGQITVRETETAAYLPSVTVNGAASANPATVTVTDGKLASVDFVNAERGTGTLTIAKEVDHDFGIDYQIPADKQFTVQVTLSGIGTANATFAAQHTNGTYTEIRTDANGQFTVQLAHSQQFEIFGLPAGTTAVVVEQDPGSGFAPTYEDNGQPGDGTVTIAADSSASVTVVNDYTAAEVYPVSITVSGNKYLSGTEWQEGYRFSFKLEKLLSDGSWQQLGQIKTASYGSTEFHFTDAFATERYTAAGNYYYRIVEIEPETPLGGFAYDKTVHSFCVRVGDADMDGQLEITEVVSSRPDTTVVTGTAEGYHINASFTNTYSTSGTATATIDVTKSIENIGGTDKSLAGFTFGLYDAQTGELVDTLSTTERGFARFVLNYAAPSAEPYRYILKEIAPDPVPAGWSYSTEELSVTVEVLDNGDGTIRAVIYTGDRKPADAGSSVAATFTNTYDPSDAELEIDFVRKELSGRTLQDSEFHFAVMDADGNTVLTGTNDASGKVTFLDTLKFSEVGSYDYTVVETSEDGNGVTVDKTAYRITVTVTDTDGKLTADHVLVNAVGDDIVFKNTYRPAAVTYAISGTKELTGRALLNDEFTFLLTEALNAQGQIADGARTYEAHNEYLGQFTFPELTYTEAGTYYYVVTEKQAVGSSYGIAYDTNQFVVTVTVKDDTTTGKLIASADMDADDIVFYNHYVATPVSKRIDGEKVLNGKTLVGGQFRFELWQSDAEWAFVNTSPIQTVANDGSGHFAFDLVDYTNHNASDFTQAGTYYFLIKEVNGGSTILGITYDDIIYRVRVEITDDLLGQLHATAHIYDNEGVPQDSVIFRNSYEITGDTDLTVTGTKTLNDAVPEDRTFEFELYKASETYAIDGDWIQKVSQDATGSFVFTVNYTPEDISDTPYYYVVKEANSGQTINGVTYDSTEYHIAVMVEDNGEGGVRSTAVIRKGQDIVTSLDFANTYQAAGVSVTVAGSKTLENRELAENEFKFLLYYADENYVIEEEAAPMEAMNDADGSFCFDALTFTEAGTYCFVILEDAGTTAERVTNDTGVYHLAIEIRDDGNGSLYEASRVLRKAGSDDEVKEITFHNVFTPKPDDITVQIGVVKTVVNKGSEKIGPEGFEFILENTATGEMWTVKTDASGNAAFTLRYTEDDIGRTYTYKLFEVNGGKENVSYSTAEYTVTAAIMLNENNELVVVLTENGEEAEAVVAEFENIYDNTPTPPDNPDSPKTGDTTNLLLWLCLMVVSGGGIFGTTLYGRKRVKNVQ